MMLPIIQSHVESGTIVRSDEWGSYRRIASIPGIAVHETVNHSLHFVDPSTGVHTHVESYWNRVKIKFKRMRGVDRDQLPSYLDEFMWRGRMGKTHSEAFGSLLDAIADQYPVL